MEKDYIAFRKNKCILEAINMICNNGALFEKLINEIIYPIDNKYIDTALKEKILKLMNR